MSKEPLLQKGAPAADADVSDVDGMTEEVVKAKLRELATKDAQQTDKKSIWDSIEASWLKSEYWLGPLLLTLLSFFVRTYKIGLSDHVVWDEAHFGKFGSYYLRHSFYHDVHPPLGKMLVGFSGYLAGYNGSWDFPSGEQYPEYIDYVKMRLFNATFGALLTPFAYFTAKEIGYPRRVCWLFGLMVCLESTYTTLARFILLDSMLLFFTGAAFYCMCRFHNHNRYESQCFTRKWWKWIILTGIALGAVDSVKMVGLFVTSVVGLYTIMDLWIRFGRIKDNKISVKRYISHWISRIACLIVIPFLVYMLCFKIHFDLLSGTGPGDATMSSLFQANLDGSTVSLTPRDVMTLNSTVTLKNQGLGGGLLHSHVQTYPEGSNQQQVTTYGHKDDNNEWTFELVRDDPRNNFTEPYYVVDGMKVRLLHRLTGRNLHSHLIDAPVSVGQGYEVAGYGSNEIGDDKDNWVVEVMYQYGDEDKMRLHPLTTSFRLRHQVLGCYLGTSDQSLPQWGFRQGEVLCFKNSFQRDKRTWWNIEDHVNPTLPNPPEGFKLPKTNFFKDFVQLNIAMLATNNALVPDEEKEDMLSSESWQWPVTNVGIRLCGWGDDQVKYFLIGGPFTTWSSTGAIILFACLLVVLVLHFQRQIDDFPPPKGEKAKVDEELLLQKTENDEWNTFVMGGFYALFGWIMHYLPFVVMGRVKYVHHYMPAEYFAMLVFCYIVHLIDYKVSRRWFTVVGYSFLYILAVSVYIKYAPFSFGMTGPATDYDNLKLLDTWKVD